MLTLGFDTSNYTTSVAAFDGVGGQELLPRLLDVKPRELGLRQSDALFAHVKRLPELVQALCASVELKDITAIGRQHAAAGRRRLVYAVLSGWLVAGELPRADPRRAAVRVFSPAGAYRGESVVGRRLDLMPGAASGLASVRAGTTELLARRAGWEECEGGKARRDQRYLCRSAHRPHRQAPRPAVPGRKIH